MSEHATTQTQRSPLLTGIRRAEAMALAVLAFGPLVSFGAPGAPLSLALIVTAAILLPRRRERAVSTHEDRQLQTLRMLLTEGSELRARYLAISALPSSLSRTSALTGVRLDVIKWIQDSHSRLEPYPEFLGIFEAHGGLDLSEELDGRVDRLGEIVHLAQAGRRLGLSI
jgi:hypothetical protein